MSPLIYSKFSETKIYIQIYNLDINYYYLIFLSSALVLNPELFLRSITPSLIHFLISLLSRNYSEFCKECEKCKKDSSIIQGEPHEKLNNSEESEEYSDSSPNVSSLNKNSNNNNNNPGKNIDSFTRHMLQLLSDFFIPEDGNMKSFDEKGISYRVYFAQKTEEVLHLQNTCVSTECMCIGLLFLIEFFVGRKNKLGEKVKFNKSKQVINQTNGEENMDNDEGGMVLENSSSNQEIRENDSFEFNIYNSSTDIIVNQAIELIINVHGIYIIKALTDNPLLSLFKPYFLLNRDIDDYFQSRENLYIEDDYENSEYKEEEEDIFDENYNFYSKDYD